MNDTEYEEYCNRTSAIQDKVDDAITESFTEKGVFIHALKHGERVDAVIYSAGDTDDRDMPIDNLNEVPHKGTFIVIGEYDEFWDGRGIGLIGDPIEESRGCEYRSELITDPTWLQLAVLANESIFTTNDFHHAFFENVNLVGDRLYLSFGS